MIREVKDTRPVIGKILGELQDRVLKERKLPTALMIQMFWDDGEITRTQYLERGFNLLSAIGILELLKNEISDTIRGKPGGLELEKKQ